MVAATQPGVSDAKKRWLSDPQVVLMLRVQGGDDEAFAQLVRELRPRVYGYFVRLVRNRTEAEDLAQEVFLRLFRSRISYKPKARLSTWVYHITQNVARNALRSQRRRPTLPVDFSRADELFLSAPEVPPSLPLERDELAQLVRAAVGELADRQRVAVTLHQLEGWTYNEVADRLGMSPKAAKSLLYRARNQLREALAPVVV